MCVWMGVVMCGSVCVCVCVWMGVVMCGNDVYLTKAEKVRQVQCSSRN